MRRPIFLFLALGAGCWLWHRASVVESPPVVAGAQGVKPRVAAEVPQEARAVAGPALLAQTVTQKLAAVHPLVAMRQDVRWEQPVAEPEFADFNAEQRFDVAGIHPAESPLCIAGAPPL